MQCSLWFLKSCKDNQKTSYLNHFQPVWVSQNQSASFWGEGGGSCGHGLVVTKNRKLLQACRQWKLETGIKTGQHFLIERAKEGVFLYSLLSLTRVYGKPCAATNWINWYWRNLRPALTCSSINRSSPLQAFSLGSVLKCWINPTDLEKFPSGMSGWLYSAQKFVSWKMTLNATHKANSAP